MKHRAEKAQNTANDIMKVLGDLWLKHSIHDITLDMVAEEAGVSVRTILRKYNSKEGLFEAALDKDVAGIQAIKDEAVPGDIYQAVDLLLKEYQFTGDAAIRTLALENELPIAGRILNVGRKMHTQWCERVFAEYLPSKKSKNYSTSVGAFYAATDVYNWKLLKHDLKFSNEEIREILINTLQGLIQQKNK